MAVDASIWIYQFLTALRDKQGNRLLSAHIVGFFRRICKLLYFGIKPIFVFDGGVPFLKRETIRQRREQRERNQEKAEVTARKLLALEIQRQQSGGLTSPSKKDTKKLVFRPTDDYDLPHVPGFAYEEGDNRVLSAEEYNSILSSIDELDGIDINSINPASKEFEELPRSVQYMIISASRLHSRLRMGYSREQLQQQFPDSMEFSKFQIEMVKRRNFFTQKLLDLTDAPGGGLSNEYSSKISCEKDREYKLIKTGTGWAMSLEPNDGSEASKAILIEDTACSSSAAKAQQIVENDSGESSDDNVEWEDIDIVKKKVEYIPDYSLNSMRLRALGNIDRTVGSQSFLDTRTSNAATDAVPRGQVGHYVDSEEDDSDDLFSRHLEELEMMEKVKARNAQRRSIREVTHMHNAFRGSRYHTQDLTSIQGDGSQVNISDKKNEVIECVRITDEVPEPQSLTNSDAATCTSRKANETPAIHASNSDLSGDASPKTNEAPMPLELKHPDLAQKVSPKATDATNDIGFPKIDLASGSFLFGDEKAQTLENDKKRTTKSEVPTWFQTSIMENPHTDASFTAKLGAKTNDMNSDEQAGLLTGSNAFEIIKGKRKLEQNATDSETDIEIIEQLTTRKVSVSSQKAEKEPSPPNEDEKNFSNPATNGVIDYYFPESEEEELVQQLEKEQVGYNIFSKNLNPNITTNKLIDELNDRYAKEKRSTESVNAEMLTQIQILLEMFGIPYITAPMEAEAQCAELLRLKLVDGIITDDSDVFLFGGTRVYKNMFHEKNYVEYYCSEAIQTDLGLDRNKLIALAQLLGSDYAPGVKGIGKVTGLEILAEYGDLENFRNWYNEGQFNREKLESESSFQKALRRRLVNNEVVIGNDFPSQLVYEAYINPNVDHDSSQFKWGVPDLDRLRSHLQETVGWPIEKSDEILVPLIKELNQRKIKGTQTTLVEFFPTKLLVTDKNLKMGKRVQSATRKLKKRRK